MVQKQLNSNLRYERKYIVPNHLKDIYKICFLENSNLLKELFQPRLVYSIYYDTEDLFLANKNIEGDSKRYKIRTRFYNNKNPDFVYLEIKSKNCEIGDKKVLKIKNYNKLINKDLINLEKHTDFFSGNISLINKLNLLFPVLFVAYKRYYFTDLNKNIRVTFDENISYQNLRNYKLHLNDNSIYTSFDENCIIEIKYPVDKELRFDQIISHLDLRVQRNSKYINGLNKMMIFS